MTSRTRAHALHVALVGLAGCSGSAGFAEPQGDACVAHSHPVCPARDAATRDATAIDADSGAPGDASRSQTADADAGIAPHTSGDGGDSGTPEASGPGCRDALAHRLSTLLDDWPVLVHGRETRSFSSYDRTGGNSDGFDGTYSELYVSDTGEHVIFDAVGPGVLDTLWFTGPNEGGAGLDLGTVRFYLDDETTPRIELPWMDLFRGNHAPFLAPLVADNATSTGAFVSWVPVPYARRLIVTTGKRPGFYQAHYEVFPPDAVVASFDGCAPLEARAAFQTALDFCPSTAATPVPLDSTYSGAGTLDVIQFQPDHEPTEAELQSARLRIAWDGEATPSVDAPLGAFFGSGLGAASVHAIPFSMDGGVYESRFRMPFWSGFHLSLIGLSGALRIHVGAARYSPSESGYFHAESREARPTTPGEDFEWLGATGTGKLVGTVLTVRPPTPTTKRWWEGDTRSYANGRRTPGIEGTGHEDDHLAGWSTTLFENPFTLPLHGVPATTIVDTTGQVNANATFYRLYPGIEFVSGVRHSTEHGSRNVVQGDYRGVAFYYADAAHTALVETDRVTPSDPTSTSGHAYFAAGEHAPLSLSSSFEGRDDQTVVVATTVDHDGTADFDAAIDAANAGCFLRRMYDQRNGRQRARVRVDGAEVGTWYTADFNATKRWAERDYFLPATSTSGKTHAHIEIAPDAGAPAWSVAEYRVLCVEATQ